jgi:hypothetical protein
VQIAAQRTASLGESDSLYRLRPTRGRRGAFTDLRSRDDAYARRFAAIALVLAIAGYVMLMFVVVQQS